MKAISMRSVSMLLLAAPVFMTACHPAPEVKVDPPVFGRVDCQRLADKPELKVLFEQDIAICKGRSEAAAVSGTAAMPIGHGLAGEVLAGMNKDAAARQISQSTLTSCMAERGYILRTVPEHIRVCALIAAAKPQQKR